MKSIGGYFELELKKGDSYYHDTPYITKSGRSSLMYILTLMKPKLVYIPYYTCNALLEPFNKTGTAYEFYEINESLAPKKLIELKPGEYFLYVNYMGLKNETVSMLSEKYKEYLIVDCTQAFFMKGNSISWFFNSCRKFFGVPDGSFLYPPAGIQLQINETQNEEYIVDHLLKRFNGHVNDGYIFFMQNELLAGKDMRGMSLLSEYLLSQVNYNKVAEKRRGNYNFLHSRIKSINLFPIREIKDAVPMHYPLLLAKSIDKTKLFSQGIFIPTFWKEISQRNIDGFTTSGKLSEYLLPLPIDQRYNITDMLRIVLALEEIINN